MVKLSEIIAPCFWDIHKDIKERKHTHYWFKGGRASTKSSNISIEIVLNVIKDPECNAICFRKIGKDIEESVYNQILWAIDTLGVSDYFKAYKSPYRIVYIPTGQVIAFRGLDDAKKTKSIKLKKGYFKISWFEELDEFDGIEEVRKAEQSIMRGGNQFLAFKSYNPPQNINNWVNKEVSHERADRLVIHNTYLDVPREWLGEQVFIEAEFLKQFNELAYRHEYLGEVTGTGGIVFPNVQNLQITDEMINSFDNLREGIDWGFAADPFAWNKMHYDKTRRILYIYDEIHKVGLTNDRAMEELKNKTQTLISADSAEPK
jgi:PBSX family phage terminase large subunit